MQSIRSLVAIDDRARFRSDVQLDLFEDAQENLALLTSYLFTVAAPGSAAINAAKMVSSVDLLNHLLEAFISSSVENRIVTIANYGHGKSHLALALANYFSKPFNSDEIQLIQDKLEHALNDPAKSSRFRDFKKERGEFLVVRLRGDTPSNLREQFIPNLEKALSEHPATANCRPPIWHEYAEQVLTSLNEDEICRANERLAVSRLDVPTLIAQVRQRRDVREHCIEALTSAKNMAPNLGAQLSLRETVEWVANTLCGEGKPLAGILIMFDEFSLYVSRYAQRGAVGELQDLLNGVSSRPAKVVFLAFAQHDPATIADNAPLSDHGRDTLKHELTRIPKKLALYTLMESVMDAYLRQRESIWLEFTKEWQVRLSLERASHVAYESFLSRYTNGLRWLPDKFEKTVTKGCFPLHPLTTALLCNLKFSSVGSNSDPRTVLGFVMEHLTAKLDQPLLVDQEINWVPSIALVDYFGESISPEVYRAYQSARRNLSYDVSEEQRKILMALYLQEAAQISLSSEMQRVFLGEASVMVDDCVTEALTALSTNNVIRYDTIKKTYSFWPSDSDPGKLERSLRSKLEKTVFDLTALQKLNAKLTQEYGYCIPMNVNWGHPEDWAANQAILTKEYLEGDYIRSLIKSFTANARGVEEGNRGLVIWLLARNEEEVRWCRENAETILSNSLNGDTTPPVLVVLPKEPTFDLIEAFRRSLALQGLSQDERTVVGAVVYEHEVQQNYGTIKAELSRVIGRREDYLDVQRDPSSIVAPLVFRASILALRTLSIRTALSAAYTLAYRGAPREFFTQFRVNTKGANNLRNAVKQVAGVLFTGQTNNLASSIRTNATARDLCDKYFVQKWGMLSTDHALQVPTDGRLHQAWEFLNSKFPPGSTETPLITPLIELMNPPYGFDFNTVTLLLASWFGYHNHDLELKEQGWSAKHSILADFLQKGPQDFLQNCKLRNIALSRRNPDELRLIVGAIIARTGNSSFTEEEATDAIAKLESFSRDTRNNQRDCDAAQTKVEKLQEALDSAKQYRDHSWAIQQKLEAEATYRSTLAALDKLKDLPTLTLVATKAPQRSTLQQTILTRLEVVVEEECRILEKPQRYTQVELNERNLATMRELIRRQGVAQMDVRIQKALETLKQTAQELKVQQSEEEIRTEIDSIDASGSLNSLTDKIKRLQQLNSLTSEVLMLRDQKLEYLTHAVNDLECQVQQIQLELDNATTSQVIEENRDRLLKNLARYQDSIYQEVIQTSLERASKLREFFDGVKKIQGQPVQTVKDFSNLHQQCEGIRTYYYNVLSPTQLAITDQLAQAIDTKLAAKQRDAVGWLQACTMEVQRGTNIPSIVEKLSYPPPFLPDNHLPELDALRALVQAWIDSDALLQVEKAFRTIADRKQQEECLRRLTQIMNEQPSASWAFWRRKA